MTFAARLSAICFAALLAACTVGGGDGMDKGGQTPGNTDPGDPDDPGDMNPDDDIPPPPPPDVAACELDGPLDLAGAETGAVVFAQEDMPTKQAIEYFAYTPDGLFVISLWDGYGALANGFAPGSYQIETDPDTCGVCAAVLAGETADDFAHFLAATGGSIQLDAIDPAGQISGSASGMTFEQVDPDSGAPLADGCNASVASHSFDAQVEPEAPEAP